MVSFALGELFNSFAHLQQKLHDYSEDHFCHFYIKDSKKLAVEESHNPHLLYKHIVYSCIYGGQKPRFRGSGNRSVTSIRHGCTAGLYLRITKDLSHLQVRSFSEAHNHEISEELYRSAAQDRRLPYDLKGEVEELLLLGADKDRLVEYVRHVTNKQIEKKHLFNMYESAIKQQREITRDRAISIIQKVYGTDAEEDAEQILTQLLETPRPQRRSRKNMPDQMEDGEKIEYTYYNENEEGPNNSGAGEELQQLVGTMQGSDEARIVILQGDEHYEVVEADNSMEEYLEEDERESEEVRVTHVKQEIAIDDSASNSSSQPSRVTNSFLTQKRPFPAVLRGRLSNKEQDHYAPASKLRRINSSNDPVANDEDTFQDGTNSELLELRINKLRCEHEKLVAETEMLKLKRNKLVRDISKVDLEKSKLYLEIDLSKQNKKYLNDKMQMVELKNEKLRLEIAKLKTDANSNQP